MSVIRAWSSVQCSYLCKVAACRSCNSCVCSSIKGKSLHDAFERTDESFLLFNLNRSWTRCHECMVGQWSWFHFCVHCFIHSASGDLLIGVCLKISATRVSPQNGYYFLGTWWLTTGYTGWKRVLPKCSDRPHLVEPQPCQGLARRWCRMAQWPAWPAIDVSDWTSGFIQLLTWPDEHHYSSMILEPVDSLFHMLKIMLTFSLAPCLFHYKVIDLCPNPQ